MDKYNLHHPQSSCFIICWPDWKYIYFKMWLNWVIVVSGLCLSLFNVWISSLLEVIIRTTVLSDALNMLFLFQLTGHSKSSQQRNCNDRMPFIVGHSWALLVGVAQITTNARPRFPCGVPNMPALHGNVGYMSLFVFAANSFFSCPAFRRPHTASLKHIVLPWEARSSRTAVCWQQSIHPLRV